MNIYRINYERLIAYAANELNADESVSVGLHLKTYRQCATTVRCFQFICSLLRADDSQLPPAATIARAQALFSCLRFALQPKWLHIN